MKVYIWLEYKFYLTLLNKTLKAPFIPPKGGNFDKKYCEAVENHTEETLERYQQYRNKKNFERLFEGYTYINNELIRITSGNDNSNTRVTTNTKYSKPVISTNPSANDDKRKNRINNLMNNELVFNTQKKNKTPIIIAIVVAAVLLLVGVGVLIIKVFPNIINKTRFFSFHLFNLSFFV